MSIETHLLKTQKKIGLSIKYLREQKGISQLDLASLCNYEKSTISRIENGRTNLTLKTILTISRALEIDYVEIFQN